MMERLELDLGPQSYPILVGGDCLAQLPGTLRELGITGKLGIVSSPDIFALYGERLISALSELGYDVLTVMVEPGESSKTLATVERLYDELLGAQFDRSSTLVALGGGVVGDITGFVAATLLRGIKFVQVPTTLLAMVDSSVGGKTGVNHSLGKNLIGAFHQPQAVFIDVATLQSLPSREVISGLAELIKTGAIGDRQLFEDIAANLTTIIERTSNKLLIDMIMRACRIKANDVIADERESGVRRILNFGHTIGHAIEAAAGMGRVKHGEAVAMGMVGAGLISRELGGLAAEDFTALERTVGALPLPRLGNLDSATIINYLRRDKKMTAGNLHFVLLKKFGQAEVSLAVNANLLERTIVELLGRYA